MLWLLAQLVISSLPEAYPITLETLNWCAPALGFVLVSMAVLWMVALRHYITGPETGHVCACLAGMQIFLVLHPGVSQKLSNCTWPLQVPSCPAQQSTVLPPPLLQNSPTATF